MAVELRLDVFASAAHELACHVLAFIAHGNVKNIEGGEKWHHDARSAMTPELKKAVVGANIGSNIHGPWSSLLEMTYVHRWATVDEMLRGLESVPERDLVMQIAGVDEFPGTRAQLGDLIMLTAAGEKGAARELARRGPGLGHTWAPQLARWLPRMAPRLREVLIEVLSLWRRDLFGAEEERLTAILERDALGKQTLAKRLAPVDVLEQATNGMVWADHSGLDSIALLPTWVMRPWTYQGRAGDTAVISYPVADESLGGSADATVARTVKLARVLADDSRVRAIQLMAIGPLTLQELADKLGLRKSTVHHHLAEMKAAGLLRVPMGTKEYSLRPEALDRFGALLTTLAEPARAALRKTS
jgi:DNA-binding transcriptional ArsR family regulator